MFWHPELINGSEKFLVCLTPQREKRQRHCSAIFSDIFPHLNTGAQNFLFMYGYCSGAFYYLDLHKKKLNFHRVQFR